MLFHFAHLTCMSETFWPVVCIAFGCKIVRPDDTYQRLRKKWHFPAYTQESADIRIKKYQVTSWLVQTPTDATGTNLMFPHRPFSWRFLPKQSLRHRRRSRHLFRMGFTGRSFALGWQFKSFWFLIGLRHGHVKFTHRRRSANKHGGHVTREDTGADCFRDLRAVLHSWDLYFYLSTSFVIPLPFPESMVVHIGKLYSYSKGRAPSAHKKIYFIFAFKLREKLCAASLLCYAVLGWSDIDKT